MMRTLLLTHPAERGRSTRMTIPMSAYRSLGKIPMIPSTATCTISWSGSREPKAKNMRTSWLHRTTERVIRQGNSHGIFSSGDLSQEGADDCYESYDRVCMRKAEYGGKRLMLTTDKENN